MIGVKHQHTGLKFRLKDKSHKVELIADYYLKNIGKVLINQKSSISLKSTKSSKAQVLLFIFISSFAPQIVVFPVAIYHFYFFTPTLGLTITITISNIFMVLNISTIIFDVVLFSFMLYIRLYT